MSKRKEFFWKAIQTVCWFIFAGLCVQVGALLFNYIYSLVRPIATSNLHLGLNLSALYLRSKFIYTLLMLTVILLSTVKAIVFYYVITLFKKLKIVDPFTEVVSKILYKISYYAISVGVLSFMAEQLCRRISNKGYDVGIIGRYWSDTGAYLMLSAVLFVIALIFQKGIELQNENDLTV